MKSALSSALFLVLASARVAGDTQAAATQTEGDPRLNIIPEDTQLVFDFFNSSEGHVVTAAVEGHTVGDASSRGIGNDVATTIGLSVGPCGFITSHTHPLATETGFPAKNETIQLDLLVEDFGDRFIMKELRRGMVNTIFPQSAIHFQMNTSCEPVTFVAAFNNKDSGVQSLTQRCFGLPPDILFLALGDIGVREMASLKSKMTESIVLGASECLTSCNSTPLIQPKKQQQSRVSSNAFPSEFPPHLTPTTSESLTLASPSTGRLGSSVPTSATANKQNLADNAEIPFSNLGGNSSSSISSRGVSPAAIALLVIIAILIIGYGVIAFIFLRRGSDSTVERRIPQAASSKGSAGIYYRARTHENLGEYSSELELYGEPFSSSSGQFAHAQTSSTVESRYEWNRRY